MNSGSKTHDRSTYALAKAIPPNPDARDSTGYYENIDFMHGRHTANDNSQVVGDDTINDSLKHDQIERQDENNNEPCMHHGVCTSDDNYIRTSTDNTPKDGQLAYDNEAYVQESDEEELDTIAAIHTDNENTENNRKAMHGQTSNITEIQKNNVSSSGPLQENDNKSNQAPIKSQMSAVSTKSEQEEIAGDHAQRETNNYENCTEASDGFYENISGIRHGTRTDACGDGMGNSRLKLGMVDNEEVNDSMTEPSAIINDSIVSELTQNQLENETEEQNSESRA